MKNLADRVGHVHFIFFVSILFALGSHRERNFRWNTGRSFSRPFLNYLLFLFIYLFFSFFLSLFVLFCLQRRPLYCKECGQRPPICDDQVRDLYQLKRTIPSSVRRLYNNVVVCHLNFLLQGFTQNELKAHQHFFDIK